ncbi:glycosyltransferase [Marinobacter sp.]|uniref:glycosyltransferase n=1 Tax=Marinobacter sp. TaxID=50741 RepID=UPI0038503007
MPINSINTVKNEPEISIIIPAFNESKFITQTLTSVANSEFSRERFEIIVVDNGSTDCTLSLAERFADVTAILPDVNVGAVRNYGVKLSSGQLLIFIDADCVVESTWLRQAHKLAIESRDTIFGGICKAPKQANWIERFWLLDSENRKQRDLTGACIVVSRNNFDLAGGFNENITSGEDTNFSEKLRSLGKSVEICPDFYVTHLGNADTLKRFISRQAWHGENYFYNIKSSLRDPTFILCVFAFIIAVLTITLPVILKLNTFYLLLILLIIPAIFSAKRILYSRYFTLNPVSLLKIYILDGSYVIGRCLGILKSSLPRANKH